MRKKNGIVHRNLYSQVEVTELVILEISSNITFLEISRQQHHISTYDNDEPLDKVLTKRMVQKNRQNTKNELGKQHPT